MLEAIKDLPAGIDGLKAIGKVSKEDYESVFEPMLSEARNKNRRIRMLYELGAEFEGFSAGAAWEDAKLGLRSLRLFEGCAIVTDIGWLRESARFAGFFLPCPVQVFGARERAKAAEWLRSLPEGPGASHRLLADRGVILVEVKEPLRVQDFDSLALTADTWTEAHGRLRGLVIHAREFPGWEDFAGLLRHLRFIRDHHRKVERIALAADGKLASLAPRLAEHFIAAEIKPFPYDRIGAAIEWAASGRPREVNS